MPLQQRTVRESWHRRYHAIWGATATSTAKVSRFHIRWSRRMTVLDRFLRYVTYDTQAREDSDTYPSTPGQLVLLRDLVTELHAMGIADAAMDGHGYVMATIPATATNADVPVIGFIAHV